MKCNILDNFFLLVHITLRMAMMLLLEDWLRMTDRESQPQEDRGYSDLV